MFRAYGSFDGRSFGGREGGSVIGGRIEVRKSGALATVDLGRIVGSPGHRVSLLVV